MYSNATTNVLKFPGTMTMRGFWLYVWRVKIPEGELLYVGRTGDSSSPNAAAPFARAGQQLGKQKNQNPLRKYLMNRGIQPEDCEAFELVAHGPIYKECETMPQHKPFRNLRWSSLVGQFEGKVKVVFP